MADDWLTAALTALNGLPSATPAVGNALTIPPAVAPGGATSQSVPPPSPSPLAPADTGTPVGGFPAPLGTAPRDPQFATQGTGFLGNLTSALTNPLTQAALHGYFSAISAPRGTSGWGRLGIGGASALDTLSQQEALQQMVYPSLRTETQQRQQLAAQEAMKTQALQQQMRPASQASLDLLDSYISREQQTAQTLTDPIEKQVSDANLLYMQSLREGVMNQTVSGASLMAYLQSHNVAQQQNQAAQAAAKYYQALNAKTIGGYLPNIMASMGSPGASPGAPPGTTAPAGTPPTGAPAMGAAPEVIGLPAGKALWPDLTAELSTFPAAEADAIAGHPFKINLTSGSENVRRNPADPTKWQYELTPGSWYELAGGVLTPVT